MLQTELFAKLGWAEPKPEKVREEWSGDDPSGDTIEVTAELSGARLNVLSWRKSCIDNSRQETLRVVFEPLSISQPSRNPNPRPNPNPEWEMIAVRVSGIPCPLREKEAMALFDAARTVAKQAKPKA